MTEVQLRPHEDGENLHGPYETFLERAAHETDQDFAEDLYLCAQIAADLQQAGSRALAVGGYARDSVLSRLRGVELDSKDIDIEVYGLPFDELAGFLGHYGQVDLVGASFGIAMITNPASGNMLDFSIPREDSKVDKGHRGFKVTGNPHMTTQDAARRRDLTINALSIDPLTGELIDHYGGVSDARAGILRATDPELFKDDPLRALRVMQFAGRFGFAVDPDTADICRSLDLSELPGSRIGKEWIKLLTRSERPSIGLEVARDLGVISQLHPELARTYDLGRTVHESRWTHTKRAVDTAAKLARSEHLSDEDAVIVMFSALCTDMHRAHSGDSGATQRFLSSLTEIPGKSITKCLRILDHALVALEGQGQQPSDKDIYRLADKVRPASLALWNIVSRADTNGFITGPHDQRAASQEIFEHAERLGISERAAEPIIQGRHLIEHLHMQPNPRFRDVLDFFYDAQISGHFTTVEEALSYYDSLEPHQRPLADLAEK